MVKWAFFMGLVLLLTVTGAWGDWDPGDGHKMHFPQLPDPNGWDINFSSDPADDWVCTQTGPVNDIHIWYSEANDGLKDLESIGIYIYANDPNFLGQGYSSPGATLWWGSWVAGSANNDFSVTTRLYGTGDQGFYSPKIGAFAANSHENIYQLNITDFRCPFQQYEGSTYWFRILGLADNRTFGWKTADLDAYPIPFTGNHYMDNAVYTDNAGLWAPLTDPITQEALDLAFVITPEPTSLALLTCGALALVRRRR